MPQESNPYLPPETEITVPDGNRPLVIAGKGRRFGTLVVDYVLHLAFSVCIGVVIALAFGVEGVEAIDRIPHFLLGIMILSAYYLFFEGIWGRTPGKFVFGTVVVNESGAKPSIGQVIGRTLCRFIPFEPFSFLGERG